MQFNSIARKEAGQRRRLFPSGSAIFCYQGELRDELSSIVEFTPRLFQTLCGNCQHLSDRRWLYSQRQSRNGKEVVTCGPTWKEGKPPPNKQSYYCPNQHCDRESIGHVSVSALRKLFIIEPASQKRKITAFIRILPKYVLSCP